ncbi:hypothetical protein SAMN04490244_11096 [Tranquillimonas rosea]|uniref:Lipoprotein n=1 Tax=Tranquillimonas rosea TaxID=641238 RepID=A0A1H9WDT8_9RHOB|nr:hypothetical protein [Tranquillimonas rosea]SES31984.1 hypothetical protein SAMN04490244_11096 [Tranquillimonas rosea]
MTGSNKILTVSYGTFSCTLEGFDQPFSTMQSIAEYFRDLAAQDRYFGAEPPQPDAEMLHRIAEREVQRRVEAHVDDGNVTLRQMAPDSSAPERAEAPSRPAPAAPLPEAEAEDVDPADDSVAAKLSRIRAVVARARAERDAEPAIYEEDEPTEPVLGASQLDTALRGADLGAAPDEPDFGTELAPGDESESRITAAESLDLDATADPAPVPTPEDDALDTADDTDTLNDTPVEVRDEDNALADTLAAIVADSANEDAPAPLQRDDAAMVPEADDPEDLDEPDTVDAEAPPSFAAEDAPDTDTPVAAPEDDDTPDTNIAGDGFELSDEVGNTPLASDPTEADALRGAHGETDDADDEEIEIETVDDTPGAGPQARVIKLKRYEFEAALAAGELEEIEDEETAPDIAVAGTASDRTAADEDTLTADIRDLIGDSSLNADDEAELLEELAEVEREAAAASEREAREQREAEEARDADDQAFDRLLQETNAKLDDTEGSRRRSAIAHLKAAVAATKADRLLGGAQRDAQENARLEKYRDDLAQVVRPRRPAEDRDGPAQRPADPLASRPAPLMLLSDYRVDQESASQSRQPSGLVRPRRIRATPPADDHARSMAASLSFSDFAARVGATELPDILEAAAAYAAYVEGQPRVTRPELLRRAASLHPEAGITREQGLKSFGQLLRSGRIRKLGQGNFAVAETTRFAAPARAAGE